MSTFWFGFTIAIGIGGAICTLALVVIWMAAVIAGEREDKRRERLMVLEQHLWREPWARREHARDN